MINKEKMCVFCKINERMSNKKNYCYECNRIEFKKWYEKNKEYKKKKSLENLKKNNYSYEKTQKQRRMRYIKKRTRLLYPLKNQKCEFCHKKATEHHHNTYFIEIHKFNYICHSCHMKEDCKYKKNIL